MNKLIAGLTAIAIAFLAYLAGASAMYFGGPLSDYLEEAFHMTEETGAVTTYAQGTGPLFLGLLSAEDEDMIRAPAPDIEAGVAAYDPQRAQPGYTVYTGIKPWTPIRLIDMEGNTVHEWQLPDVFEDGLRDDGHRFPRKINPAITDLHLYPNGNLAVALGNDLGKMPYGFAVALLDKDSNLLWKYTKRAHHQIDVGPDGRIAAIIDAEVTEPWPGFEKIELPFVDEHIAILSAEGEELAKLSLLEAFSGTQWESALQFGKPDAEFGDIFHLNAAKFLRASQAQAIPNASPGDLLLSIRNLNALAVLNPDSGKIVWAAKGAWYRQHDPHVLDNGNILLFDNHGDLANGGRSRAIEINPVNLAIEWEWPGDTGHDLYTSVCGALERLENGNTLIAETNRGRLLEVTPEGDIVWDYYVPERWYSKLMGWEVTKAWHPQRVDPASLTFL